MNGPDVIYAHDRALCSGRRCLSIVHFYQFHPCPGAYWLRSHSSLAVEIPNISVPPVLPCSVPVQVLQQYLSSLFVLLTDKSEPEEETAECVFLIVHGLVLQGHTFDCSHVFCQLADEGDAGFLLLGILGHRKPRKSNPILCDFILKAICSDHFFDQCSLALDDSVEIGKCRIIHQLARNFHGQLVRLFLRLFLWLFRGIRLLDGLLFFLCVKSHHLKSDNHCLYHLHIGVLRPGKHSSLADHEGAIVIGTGRHLLVYRCYIDDFRYNLYKLFAFLTLYVVVQFCNVHVHTSV